METKDGRDTADQTIENWQNTKQIDVQDIEEI